MRKILRQNLVIVGAVLSSIVLVVAGAWLIVFLQKHCFFCPIMQRNQCVKNLESIERAKEECRAEFGLTNGAAITTEQVIELLPGGMKAFSCPGGGVYSIRPLGENPTCSIPGHERLVK
jgi:hypothetical protein